MICITKYLLVILFPFINLFVEYRKLGFNSDLKNMFEQINLISLDRCDYL